MGETLNNLREAFFAEKQHRFDGKEKVKVFRVSQLNCVFSLKECLMWK